MPRVSLAPALLSVCPATGGDVPGGTVREALLHVFAASPNLRSYVLDDAGAVRKHVTIFLDGAPITDREAQSDPVRPASEIFLLQALSGG